MPGRSCSIVMGLSSLLLALGMPNAAQGQGTPPVVVRVATFNLEDVRTEDLVRSDQPRVKALAEVIQRLAPTIILLNEIAYDMPGSPGFKEGDQPGQNAQRFIDNYLNVPQAPGLSVVRYKAFAAPSNTGVFSGFDLDNDGRIVDTFPPPPPTKPDGSPGEQTPEGRAYGNDCWGFGTFPGQYAMALLVDERLIIETEKVRTFRLFPWDYVLGNFIPSKPDGSPWFSPEELKVFRLSSKSHWDVPVRLPNGSVIHVLCSHPTPPVFDGPEDRNGRRNHDEIRFWLDYISGDRSIVDDNGVIGGLDRGAHFVVAGDLNADPEKGDSFKSPAQKLLAHRLVQRFKAPVGDVDVPRLAPTDTAMFRLRVDHVVPSRTVEVQASGVWRQLPASHVGGRFPSDHFPVWMDLVVPPPPSEPAPATPATAP